MQKNRASTMTGCKIIIVVSAVLFGIASGFLRQCVADGDTFGTVISVIAMIVDLWTASGCLGVIRNGVADISDH